MKKRPTIIYIRGLPGSGKTYIAAALRKTLGSSVIMLDPDAVDQSSAEYKAHVQQQDEEGVDPSLHLYRFLRAQAYQGIENDKVIIWNQPFTNLEIFHKMVSRMRDHAALHSAQLAILIVEVVIDPAIAKQRVDARKQNGGHGPSDDSFSRFVSDYKSFADEGYPSVTVHGTDVATDSVATVLKALESLA